MSEEIFMHLMSAAPVIPGPAFTCSLSLAFSVDKYLLSTGILPAICGGIVLLWIIVMIKRLEIYEKKQHQLLLQLEQQQAMMAIQEVNIQEAERKRIAEDIHDEIGSNLATIRINLQSLHYQTIQDEQRASSLLQLVDQTSMNVRRATHNLIPPLFGHVPLTNILQSYFSLLNSPEVIFHFCANKYQHCFDPRQELVLYRIVMELTNNIIRHSKASAATIQLLYFPEYLEILVEDDGIGLPPPAGLPSGIGLTGVKSRVSSLGGDLHIDSGVSGTTFIIHIPLIPQHAASC
jgi:two-component system, NarL family, sensor histidine kinase FusK